MALVREFMGTSLCLNPDCGVTIPVKRSDKDALSFSCPYCDLSAYAKAGTLAHRALSKHIKPVAAAPVAKPLPDPAPVPPAAPLAARSKSSNPFMI